MVKLGMIVSFIKGGKGRAEVEYVIVGMRAGEGTIESFLVLFHRASKQIGCLALRFAPIIMNQGL